MDVKGRQQVQPLEESMNVDGSSVEDSRTDWAATLVAVGALSIVIGLWIMASPFVIDYGSGADLNPVISGAILVALGLIRVTGSYASTVISLLTAAIGLWMVISGFVVSETVVGTWNLGVFGAVTVVLTFVAEAASVEAPRTSRG